MIKLLKNDRLPSVNFTDGFSVTKIKANLWSYGSTYPFFNVWQQTADNTVTALISKFEDTFILAANSSADLGEIKEFTDVIGYKSLQGESWILKGLNLPFKEYQIFMKKGQGEGNLLPIPKIDEIYKILYSEENESIKPTEFEGFYVDLSHRIRHGTAAAVNLENSAVCLASHITSKHAVISGVFTLKTERKKGKGSKALDTLIKALGERDIFVAAEDAALPFYLKNGFMPCGKTAVYEKISDFD